MYDPREPQNSYHGNDPFLSDSFDDLNTNYNSQDPLFPGESNQPPTGPSNTPIPPKNSGRGLTAALIVVGSLLVVAIVGGGLVFALSRGSHDKTVAQSSDSSSKNTRLKTTSLNPPQTDNSQTPKTNTPRPTVGSVSTQTPENGTKNESKEWSQSSINKIKKEQPIYRVSEGLEWLKNPDRITPGGRIINRTQSDSQCSVGYVAQRYDRFFVLTAGHCGEKGDLFAYADNNNKLINFGRMVDSTGATDSADYGLIEIKDSKAVDPAIIPLKGEYRLSRWLSPQNIRENETVCRLGFRTGLSCGEYLGQLNENFFEFRGMADHGDSGGPAFILRGNNLIAVGLESYGFDKDATRDGAVSISDALNYWNLQLTG